MHHDWGDIKKVNSDVTAVEQKQLYGKEARDLQMHSEPHAATGASYQYGRHKHFNDAQYAGIINA